MAGCRISAEYEFRGSQVVRLENESLRVEVLAGKGGDVTEIRDKRTDINVLFEAPHEWHTPDDGYEHPTDEAATFLDYYPGGWQDVLPAAGGPSAPSGVPIGVHGETTLAPWEVIKVRDEPEKVAVTLSLSLTRYPFTVERILALEAGDPVLRVDEHVTNEAPIAVSFSWLQHITFGPPLVSPSTLVDVPCTTILTDPDHDPAAARLPPDEEYKWPIAQRENGRDIDLRRLPDPDERVHDLVALTGFDEGRYTVTNPDIDLGATVRFPEDLYEYLWYWQPLGGFTEPPFFGRNYNIGLEPCTSIPNSGLDRAIDNETAAVLDGGESQQSTIELETHPA
ncbi:DUF4432 family protein [Halovenus marina]|uniref:DUF4432 family protein n=1 Tax=Halovenus marina TaxID=3396621 RepID=UPI003F56C4D3